MFYFTNDQIDEIEKRLAVRAKKDTDFDAVSEAQEGDLVAIIHNGRNMICRLDKLPGRLVAKRYDEIPAEITEENILETPTAFSISVLKTLLGIEEMPEFDDDTAYEKGSYVSYTDANGILRGYVFTADKAAGYWDESKVTEINYASLSENIKDILSEFKSGGRVYVLESYFTNGKAKKAIADEDGKNIKQYYALKTDIPDVNREIAEAIAVKLDNTPKGSHEVPIYIAPDLQTGYGKSEVIDSLHLPGDIRSDLDIFAGRGVAAYGMAELSLGGRGGSGTLTEIQIDGTTIPDINGVVNLPAYPSALSQLASDTTHRLVTDSQISSWTEKYDLPTGGIPKTDLSNSVQDTLDTADSSAVTLGNLIAGLTSKGAHNLPIYFDSNTDVQEIDSLLVPGDIQSTNGGVSALGIADLSVSSGAGRGTITEIQINSVPYPDVNGIVNLPAYPSTLSELTADSTHRVVTDSQITSWTAKYDLPSGGIPKTDLSSAVQTSLGKADNALEKFSLGAHNLPIWFNSSKEPQVIDSLSVSGDIESTAGGVSANGIASLAISSGSQGTITQIKIGDTPYPDVNGVVTLPEYPTAASLISDGLASRDWVSENYAAKSYEGRVQTIESYIPTQATSSNKLADKNFVNSSIGTATATFKGTVTAVGDSEAQAQTALATITGMDANDYAFVKVENTPQVGVDKFKRYKYTGSVWSYEYTLNNSSFTSDQWAAINSGLTSTGATTITTLGTITTGEWQGTAIADSYIASAGTWNNAVTTLINLKTGLTSKGAHDLPVYLNSSAQAVVIDALSVPGNIQSTAGGVSAQGIADLSVSGGSAGTLTLIYVGDTPYPDVNGVVTLPAYPSTLDDISDGSSRKLSDYTKTTAFQTLAVKGGTTSVGSYSPISGLELSILAGSNITVTPDATNHTITIANTYSYSLPTASSSTKGGVKVGSTLDISNEVLEQKAGIVTAGTYKSVTVDTYGRVTAGSNPTTLSGFGITDGVNSLQKSGSGYLSDVDFVEGNDHSLLFTFTSFAKAQIGHTGGSGTTTYKMRVKADGAWSDYLALQQAGASAWGIVTDQSQTFGGHKTFNGNIHGMQGVSAKGIATLEFGGGGGSGTLTQIQINGTPLTDVSGVVNIPLASNLVNGAMSSADKSKLDNIEAYANNYVLPAATSGALGGIRLGYSASGKNYPVQLDGSNKAYVNVPWTDTTYESKAAASGGTAVSLVTTGEKYNWNNKYSKPSGGIPASDLAESYYLASNPNGYISGNQTITLSGDVSGSGTTSIAVTIGTGKVTNAMLAGSIAISKISGLQTALDGKLATSLKGAANGLAELDANGLVPSSQLPSYVDDVLEYASKSAFPATGETGKIYVALDTNLTWRWSGSAYVEISPSLALGETSSTAYRGDRGATAYTHATDASRLTTAKSSGFYKFSVTAQGHISGVSAVAASDLTTLIGSTTYAPYNADGYLPLSAGENKALTSALYISPANSSSFQDGIILNDKGHGGIEGLRIRFTSASYSTGHTFNVRPDTGDAYIDANKIWHSGNDGSGSGLDADLLDGKHASELFTTLENDNEQLSATIGTTNKKLTIDYATKALKMKQESKSDQEFTYRVCPKTIDTDSVKLDRILGKTLAWNQMIRTDTSLVSKENCTLTKSGNQYVITPSASATSYRAYVTPTFIPTHYYLFACGGKYSGAGTGYSSVQLYVDGIYIEYARVTYDSTLQIQFTKFQAPSGTARSVVNIFRNTTRTGSATDTATIVGYLLIDLTLMFGSGNEPTAEQFKALYPNLIASYNSGQLINNSAKAIESVGFNLWDEVVFKGTFSSIDGETQGASSSFLATQNKIAVIPNASYYLKAPASFRMFFYDANGTFLRSVTDIAQNSVFTMPSDAYYVRFQMGYATAYNNNICFNLSKTTGSPKNGDYVPYKRVVTELNLRDIKVKSPNIWDEEWEIGHFDVYGQPIDNENKIRSKNFIPIKGGYTYYFKCPVQLNIMLYDANKNFVASWRDVTNAPLDSEKTIPYGVSFIKFSTFGTTISTYSNNICINKSDVAFNGRYFPHGVLTFNGLKSTGSVYDEITNGGRTLIRRIETVDLGLLTWSAASGNGVVYTTLPRRKYASSIGFMTNKYDTEACGGWDGVSLGKCEYYYSSSQTYTNIYVRDANHTTPPTSSDRWLDGVMLNYELANYETYELAEPIPMSLPSGTTERRLPEDTQDSVIAPFCADMTYGVNNGDILTDLSHDRAIINYHTELFAVHLTGHKLLSNGIEVVNLSDTQALTNKTYNGLTLTKQTTGFSISGGTTSKTLTVNKDVTLGDAAGYDVCDSSSASAISTNAKLVTERDVYYGLPTINGAHNYTSNTNIYAPTGAGTSGQILKSTAGTPEWINQSALVAGKATQLENARTLWGQSFNGTADIGTDKYAKMPYLLFRTITSGSDEAIGYVGRDSISNTINLKSYSGVPVSLGSGQQDDIYITTGHNVGIGTINPSEKVHVIGNILSSGNIVANGGVAARGMATLQGGAGTGNPVTQINVGSTPYTPTDGIVTLPSSYPASDVSAWAKASTRPAYNTSIATSSGTNQRTLEQNTKYALSAGDTSYIFTTPKTEVTFSTTTLTSSSTSVYLDNTINGPTFQTINISSASYGGQQFTINLKGSGSHYGHRRQVLIFNNSGRNINVWLGGAAYIYISSYLHATSGGPQTASGNPISMDDEMNYSYLLDITEPSANENPTVIVHWMDTYAD